MAQWCKVDDIRTTLATVFKKLIIRKNFVHYPQALFKELVNGTHVWFGWVIGASRDWYLNELKCSLLQQIFRGLLAARLVSVNFGHTSSATTHAWSWGSSLTTARTGSTQPFIPLGAGVDKSSTSLCRVAQTCVIPSDTRDPVAVMSRTVLHSLALTKDSLTLQFWCFESILFAGYRRMGLGVFTVPYQI